MAKASRIIRLSGSSAILEDQLETLGTDYFDGVLIHDPGQIEPTLAKNGTLAGLPTA